MTIELNDERIILLVKTRHKNNLALAMRDVRAELQRELDKKLEREHPIAWKAYKNNAEYQFSERT